MAGIVFFKMRILSLRLSTLLPSLYIYSISPINVFESFIRSTIKYIEYVSRVYMSKKRLGIHQEKSKFKHSKKAKFVVIQVTHICHICSFGVRLVCKLHIT